MTTSASSSSSNTKNQLLAEEEKEAKSQTQTQTHSWLQRKTSQASEHRCTCRSLGEKCSHLVKKQRAKFYILRRCITMLICWDDHSSDT
ncbi:hypothetical protein ACSBR2_002886 [Camellia fascicularis]